MSTWSSIGLPPVQASGYGYSVDAGLLRTQSTPTPQPRQKRRYVTDKRTFTLSANLTHAQLVVAEMLLRESGYSLFSIDVLSGKVAGYPINSLFVRLVKEYSVSAAGSDYYTIKMEAEEVVPKAPIQLGAGPYTTGGYLVTLTGVVTDYVTGLPVEGAAIRLLDNAGASACTPTVSDIDGSYSITAYNGVYQMEVSREGLYPRFFDVALT